MSDAPSIADRIRTFPTEPGVYLMRDRAGRVVYVGKAANLRARLRQYFAPSGDERFFVHLLDDVLGDIEVVVTRNATEALLVENELIKTHQPRFNVKLKDDKQFLNLRLASDHPFPRLEVVRKPKKDGARYFGPYPSATAIRRTLRLINRHFQLRTCTDSELANRSRPCLEHQIGRCPAPCVLGVPPEEYAQSLRQVGLFLDGRGAELARELRERMGAAANDMAFERAASYRDQALAVERCLEQQDMVIRSMANLDVLGLFREGPFIGVHIQRVREGRVTLTQAFQLDLRGAEAGSDRVVLTQILSRFYGREGAEVPPEILLPGDVEDPDVTAAWLSDLRGTRVRLQVPQRGVRRRLVEGACRNAAGTLALDHRRTERNREVLMELQRRLHLRRFPERIECYDISNVSGRDPVASMVVFVDGEPDTAEYRHFHIRGLDTPNDFEMMFEALSRRFRRTRDWEAPELIVIDGGKGQLGRAVAVLKELGIEDVEVVSLAKSRVTNDDPDEAPTRSPERVFVPGVKDPVVLRQNSAPLYLLTRLRDEAHRFAITFHRKTRRTRRLGSALDAVPGIGPARRRSLLRHFGSIDAVRRASADELRAVPGVSDQLATRIREALSG